jgi:hypothetical protein
MPIEMMPVAMTSAKLPGCRYCTLNKDFSRELKAAGTGIQWNPDPKWAPVLSFCPQQSIMMNSTKDTLPAGQSP